MRRCWKIPHCVRRLERSRYRAISNTFLSTHRPTQDNFSEIRIILLSCSLVNGIMFVDKDTLHKKGMVQCKQSQLRITLKWLTIKCNVKGSAGPRTRLVRLFVGRFAKMARSPCSPCVSNSCFRWWYPESASFLAMDFFITPTYEESLIMPSKPDFKRAWLLSR